jgi:hypothetical protein
MLGRDRRNGEYWPPPRGRAAAQHAPRSTTGRRAPLALPPARRLRSCSSSALCAPLVARSGLQVAQHDGGGADPYAEEGARGGGAAQPGAGRALEATWTRLHAQHALARACTRLHAPLRAARVSDSQGAPLRTPHVYLASRACGCVCAAAGALADGSVAEALAVMDAVRGGQVRGWRTDRSAQCATRLMPGCLACMLQSSVYGSASFCVLRVSVGGGRGSGAVRQRAGGHCGAPPGLRGAAADTVALLQVLFG